MLYFSKNKIKQFCKKIMTDIQRADAFFLKHKLYQVLCILIYTVTAVLMLNSYNITESQTNYLKKSTNAIRLSQGTPATLSFEAKGGHLATVRLYKDVVQSHLSASDKATVTISSSQGEEILSTEVYLYHPSRNYIMVNCGNVALDEGEDYILTFRISELSGSSVFYLSAHETNTFGSMTSRTILSDLPLGLGLVPNSTFSYSVMSYAHLIPHLVLFYLFLIGLFFNEFMKKRWVKEVYRGLFVCSLIYLAQEILNVSRIDPLQILFPFTVHHYFVLTAGMLIIILFYYMIYAISGSGTIAVTVTGFSGLAAAFTNHMKIVMRGDPATPWDLFSAGMAAKISTKYKFQISQRFVVSIIIIILIVIIVRLSYTPIVRGIRKRLLAVLFTTVIFAGLVFGVILNQNLLERMDVSYELFPPLQSFNENGTMLALALQLNHLSVDGGENNSAEATEDVIAEYVEEVKAKNLDSMVLSNSQVKPNVICIMSESFCELSEIRDIQTTEEVLPFFTSLKNESMYGDLATSIFGGGTCNTEFEFLTGYSVKSLLAGSSVYTFYVNHQLDALPQLFKDQGYITQAIHPFDAAWWGREDAYPLMGFDQFISDVDFTDPELVRGYISDKSAFERVISEYENKKEDAPLFSFLVTMQNHADFTEYWDNQAYDIKITNFPDNEFPCTEHYLSLLRESDDALKELISYFKSVDEPTIIVFFGDHKPFLDTDLYSILLGESMSELTARESLPLYTTPYLIWANYDIQTGDTGLTSPNFLGQTVLDLAGIPSPDERACLRILQTKITAVSAPAIFDDHGTAYTRDDALPEDVAQMIKDYEFIQYGKLFLDDTVPDVSGASAVSSSG